MTTLPYGTFPLVFESGVINIDDDGTLHIHLSHSIEAPHPMVTHPDGSETTIPGNTSEVHLVGPENETTVVRCGLRETDDLPSGFVFHLKGWKLLQLELSGDLTVVMSGIEEVPEWFQVGKIHRFDGPENGVKLFSGSQPLVEGSQPQPQQQRQQQQKPPPTKSQPKDDSRPNTKTTNTQSSKKRPSGCGALLMGVIMIGLPFLL